MVIVALVGPDGAGKSTLLGRVEKRLSVPVKRIYMGIRYESSNVMLPTTRLLLWWEGLKAESDAAPPSHNELVPVPGGRVVVGLLRRARSTILLLNLMAEEWYRQVLAQHFRRRAYLVLCDRSFLADYYAFDSADESPNRPIGTRVHGFLLRHLYPRPDLTIFLDAPPEVYFARKKEGSFRHLTLLRDGYLRYVEEVPNCVRVDVNRPLEVVENEIVEMLHELCKEHVRQIS